MIKSIITRVLLIYSQLFTLGINRKRFIIKQNSQGYHIENNSKNTFFTLIPSLFSSGLLFSGFMEFVVNNQEITFLSFVVFVIIHGLAGVIGFRHFLWLIRGVHILTISNCSITLSKKGTFFTTTHSILLKDIKSISPLEAANNMSEYDKIQKNLNINKKLLLHQTYGQLVLHLINQDVEVFSDLNEKEKNQLQALIQEAIQECGSEIV